MTDRTASAGRAVERAKSARRGGPSGRQAVGEYVGQPAGDAAQAVRRAGLKPGLERSFGCEAELIGLVVAQEPRRAASLARNGMVTLYVAAPGSEPIDEELTPPRRRRGDPEPAAAAPAEAEQRRARERRRASAATQAGPRPARCAQRSMFRQRPPSRSSTASSRHGRARSGRPASRRGEWPPEPGAPDGERSTTKRHEELGEGELSHEEFVVHVG